MVEQAVKPNLQNAIELRPDTSMNMTNEEFFKASMYFTDEVKLR